MARYFFDFEGSNHSSHDIDTQGSHLPDNESAEREAVATLTEMGRFSDYPDHQGYLQANVRNDAGTVLFRTTLTLRSERL